MQVNISDNLNACPDCDLLLIHCESVIGDKVHCPRCGYLLSYPRYNSVERCLALSITSLVLLIPANYLPLVGIRLVGNSQDNTLWSGVTAVFAEGLWMTAILVFLASILFPIINTCLTLFISASLYFNYHSRYLTLGLRCLQHFTEWAMLEVYLLGIIVACVKLSSMAELKFNLGLVAFLALLITNIVLMSNFDELLFWQKIKRMKEEDNI